MRNNHLVGQPETRIGWANTLFLTWPARHRQSQILPEPSGCWRYCRCPRALVVDSREYPAGAWWRSRWRHCRRQSRPQDWPRGGWRFSASASAPLRLANGFSSAARGLNPDLFRHFRHQWWSSWRRGILANTMSWAWETFFPRSPSFPRHLPAPLHEYRLCF